MERLAEPRYAQSGDLSIAYVESGRGPLDLILVPGFISHCDLLWDLPVYVTAFHRLGAFARVISFDKRGTGLSDRTLGFGSAADRMDDIRAVMDAAGAERAALVGISEGGPLSLLFAATYPDRVRALVTWGTFARGLRAPDYPLGLDPEIAGPFIEDAVARWGTGRSYRAFLSGMPEDAETTKLLARYERSAATPKLVRDILWANLELDVRAALPAVSVATLVVHRRHDPIVPRRLGRYIAEHVAGARYVELPGAFHLSGGVGGEEDAFDVIEEFLTGEPHTVERHRILKTVLFTDIVESTARAAELGDRRWRELLDVHDAAIRRELDRAGGREVKTTGDGVLAAFDGPARAIRCAQTITERARTLGLEVRAGLHTGECEVRGDDLAGIAVHIGARVAALAAPGEVLVTGTVRDLVAGSGIDFTERGAHALKGVPGEWRLLAVQE